MKQQISLHIPQPCHERWEAMTPVEHGKFCSACNKTVTDFTTMSDNQILAYFANHEARLCGRFSAGQLERSLLQSKLSRKRSWYAMFILPFAVLFQKAIAQKADTTFIEQKSFGTNNIAGDTLIRISKPKLEKYTITGKVVDEKGIPLQGASIVQAGTSIGAATDSLGSFTIHGETTDGKVSLVADYIGYHEESQSVMVIDGVGNASFRLQNSPVALGEIVVVGGYTISRQKITRKEKIDTAIKKAVRINSFSVYPNPAPKGSSITINIKQKGNYNLHFMNASSVLLSYQEMDASADNDRKTFQLLSNLASGVYYIRLINIKTKATSLEKIVVQ